MRLAPEFANAPIVEPRFERNFEEIPRYAEIERRFSSDAVRIATGFERGEMTRAEAAAAFKESLQAAETGAFVAGRRARGIASGEISEAEAAMLTGRHSRNMRYFNGFLTDIEEGKYKTGRNGPMTVPKRADLYAKSLWSLFTRGEAQDWDTAETANARYHWILDVDAEHCKDCLERAKRSRENDGFTWEQLVEVGFPGEGTVCRVHCRCHIRTVAKKAMIPETIEKAEVASTPEEGVAATIAAYGGPNMPVASPAAGIPAVRVSLPVVKSSLITAGVGAPNLAMAMPLLPKVLAKPTYLIELEGGVRVYATEDLSAIVARNMAGTYDVVQIVLGIAPMLLAAVAGGVDVATYNQGNRR